jgi:peroxiredoxin Q/BCP
LKRRSILTGWLALAGAVAFSTSVALASMKVGETAPTFILPATLGGKPFTFNLATALKKGPVVVYFYPKAFTSGCTKEAHDFATSMAEYKKMNATVIGLSGDDIATLNKFSVSECGSKFPVAADEKLIVAHSYDSIVANTFANRTSYVIAQDGKIAYVFSDLDPDKHVENTLAAVRKLSGTPVAR